MHRLTYLVAALLMTAAPGAMAQDLLGFDPASFGEVILKQKQAATGDVMLEMAIGDYNNEFISTYSPQSVFAKMGRSVGRLDILTDKGTFPCTAFLVGEDLLMTNHHCVPGILDDTRINASAIAAVQFVTGYTQEGITAGTEKFMVNPIPIETNKDLDYSVLRVLGSKPGKKHGAMRLASLQPRDNDPYWIIGHPMGEAQRISREKCRANSPALSDYRLLHTCDTLPGNSGSPVIDASTQMVIALHHAGSSANSVNFAIPMSLILESSNVLKASETDTPQAPPDPKIGESTGVTDLAEQKALYDIAVQTDRREDYQVYLEMFPNGLFVLSARTAIDRLTSRSDPAPAHLTPRGATTPVEEMTGPRQFQVTDALRARPANMETERALQMNHAKRREVQARLMLSGANVGVPDGSFGPNTRRGIGSWQTTKGLVPTTYLNEEQLQILMADTEAAWQAWSAANPAPVARAPKAATSKRPVNGTAGQIRIDPNVLMGAGAAILLNRLSR